MDDISGALLREQRKRAGVGLRRVAGRSAWSVSAGHLSRVERGERPVTPAIVAVYEQALGIRIADAAAQQQWRPVELDTFQPEAFTSTIGKVAAGGSPVEPVERLLEAAGTGNPSPPSRVGRAEVAHVEHAAAMIRQLDLRYGGALACQLADGLLRWTISLRQSSMSDAVRASLHTATGALAMWAAWAAFDDGRHRAARNLSTLALEAAVAADDADLRAHVLADIAAQYSYLGHPEQCLTILRLEGDERVGPAVRCVMHGVRAYAYAARQEAAACLREIDLAGQAGALAEAGPVPNWFGGFDPAHTQAVCGHAAALLAHRTGGDAERAEAYKRLTEAAGQLDPVGRGRAVTLCQARLALLHLTDGEVDEAAGWVRRLVAVADGVRSVRLRRDLAAVNKAGSARLDDPRAQVVAGQVGLAAPPPTSRPGGGR